MHFQLTWVFKTTTFTCLIVDIYPELYVMVPEVVSWMSNTIKTTLASLYRFWRKELWYMLKKDVQLPIQNVAEMLESVIICVTRDPPFAATVNGAVTASQSYLS